MKYTRWIAILGCVVALPYAATAQERFPAKPVTIVVGTAPGGPQDIIARILAAAFEKAWGQSAVVENRTGGGSIRAIQAVARAEPDGHILAVGSNTSDLFVKDVGFEPTKDVVAVSVIGQSNYFLVVSRGAKASTLKEFVQNAGAAPGKYNAGFVPNGPHHPEFIALQNALGVKVTLVGYRGAAAIQTALLSNEVDLTLSSTAPPQLKTGEIVGLAIGGSQRHPQFPNIPTFREQGFAYDPVANLPLYTKAGTPQPILEKIAAEVKRVALSPEFAAKMDTLNVRGVGASPDESKTILAEERSRLTRILDQLGIKPQ